MGEVLPTHFCWTRCGTEAGERLDAILLRKEREREQNDGVFLWGIGNALGPSMRELLKVENSPEVIFSPIRSAPKSADVSPAAICSWTSARDLYGAPVRLPRGSTVTSRASTGSRAPRHYALVCYSDRPLFVAANPPSFSIAKVENLLTGKHVGASQVTAVVRRVDCAPSHGALYRLAFRARLVAPFFIELAAPRVLASSPPFVVPAAS